MVAAQGLAGVRARAAEWPEKPISVILPFTAGGPSDNFARVLAQQLNQVLGQPGVLIMNRPGAAGNVGMADVAAALPDGYTLGIATNAVASHEAMVRRPIVTIERLAWIANLVFEPSVLVVRPGTFATLAGFVAAARSGQLSVGHAGIGSSHQIALTLFERRAGIEIVQVPFNGSSQAKTQMLGGHIDGGIFPLSEVLTMIRDGQGVGLAITTAERSRFAPTLPTFRESGMDIVSGTRRGMVGPASLPLPIRARLVDSLRTVMQSAEMNAVLEGMQVQADWLESDAYLAQMERDLAAVRSLNLMAQ
jgi:tripartite-type tricarboxylate transporter receptor subunit TctC